MVVCKAVASVLLLVSPLASANFLTEPQVRWSYTLPQSDETQPQTPRKGNAVVATQDDRLLFITTQDASVFILQTSDGLPIADAPYQPSAVAGAITSCQSGLSLVQDETGVDYAVYAVIDTPVDTAASGETIKSRIIALNGDGTERWSAPLEGIVVGTPAIGSDKNTIYVSHNVPNEEDSDEPYRGMLTVLSDGGGTPAVVAQVFPTEDTLGPFGPLTVKPTTSANETEVVFVAERWAGGYEYQGNVYYMTRSSDGYALEIFSEWGFSSASVPAVGAGANILFMAGVGGTAAGWTNESYSSVLTSGGAPANPDWQSEFVQSGEQNVTLEISPVLSDDNSLVFITGASDEVYCVEADSGRLLWAHDGGFRVNYFARPVFRNRSDQDGVLYTISAPRGKVQQLDVRRGRDNWSYNCEDLTGDQDCQDSVEAEFSVSQSDNTLYFGNVDGTIVALEVGTFATTAPVTAPPTSVPTDTEPLAPDSTPAPTSSPTDRPTDGGVFVTPNDSSNVNTNVKAPSGPSDTTTTALLAVSGLVAVLALGILAYVFVSVKRRRQRKNSTLPVASQRADNSKTRDGGADTGISVEAPLETVRGNSKRKKKKGSPSPPISPSRLAAIEESMVEDASIEEGTELVHHDEEEDIEQYVFDYTETTPETSFSSSQSSPTPHEKAARLNDLINAANARSAPAVSEPTQAAAGVVVAATGTAAVAGTVGSSSSESKGGPSTDDVVSHPDSETMEEETECVEMTEGQLVHVESDVPKPYYMLDTRSEGAGAVIKVDGNQIEGQVAEGAIAESAMVRVNRGSRSAYAMDPGTIATARNEDEQATRDGAMVTISQEQSRSGYAMEPPSLSRAHSMTHERSDASSVYLEGEEDIPAEGNKGPYRTEVSSKERKLLQNLQSVKSEGTMSLASIDEVAAPAIQGAMVPVNHGRSSYAVEMEKAPSHMFDDQLSTCTSMYLEDDSTLEGTVTSGDGTFGTHESAPLDERASRPYAAHSHLNSTPPRRGASSSALSPAPKSGNAQSVDANQASVRLDAVSPLAVEKRESGSTRKQAPSYIFKTPLSPGSTIASTSVYIDEEGSVEMERDGETGVSVPRDEKARPPASVKLDACSSPQVANRRTTEPVNEVNKITVRKSYHKSNKTSPVTRNVTNKSDSPSALKLSPPPPLSPTSTSTNESRSSNEPVTTTTRSHFEASSSARSMRKMRLEQMRLERASRGSKEESPRIEKKQVESNNNRASAKPSSRGVPSEVIQSANLSPQSTIAMKSITGQSQTTGNLTVLGPSSPMSVNSESTNGGLFPSSSDSDSSVDEPPPPPPVRKTSVRREQKLRSTRGTSASDRRKQQQASEKRAMQPKAPLRKNERRGSTSSGSGTKQVGTEEEPQPAVISSYFNGLIKHVEEAERKFFNPTLPPPKNPATKKSSSSYGSAEGSI